MIFHLTLMKFCQSLNGNLGFLKKGWREIQSTIRLVVVFLQGMAVTYTKHFLIYWKPELTSITGSREMLHPCFCLFSLTIFNRVVVRLICQQCTFIHQEQFIHLTPGPQEWTSQGNKYQSKGFLGYSFY